MAEQSPVGGFVDPVSIKDDLETRVKIQKVMDSYWVDVQAERQSQQRLRVQHHLPRQY